MAKIGTVWDRTAEFLSDNLAAVLPVALLAFFVPASIQGSFEAAKNGASSGLTIALLCVQIAFGILSLWGSLTIIAMALDGQDGRSAGAIGRDRLLPGLVVSIVEFAVVLALTVPIPLILMAGGLDMMALAGGGSLAMAAAAASAPAVQAALWTVALYGLALCVLLLWLSARLIVAMPVVVRQKRMLSALAESWKLTRGTTWRIVGVMLLFALVSWVSLLAAKLVFGTIFALVAGGPAEGITLASVLTSIVVAAVQTGFTVLVPAFTAKLYLALTAEAGLREGVFQA
jgi:hypothetical protein